MKAAILGTWHVHTEEYTRGIEKDPSSELIKIWDADENRAKDFAEKHGVPYTADLDEILNDTNIDSVVVCTATNEHYDVITRAAKAGKNIFTEKVLEFTTEKAQEMKEIIDESGVKFTISFPHLTFPALRYAKKFLDEGKIGDVTYARVRNVHSGASDGWLPEYFFDKEQCGGGAMMDLGAHPMYILGYYLGDPVSVSSTFTSVTGKAVEDNAVSVLEFANGVIGVSETGFVSKNFPYTIEFSGTDGGLIVRGKEVTYCCKDTEYEWVKAEDLPEEQPLPIHQWISAVENDTEAPFGTDMAVKLTKFMDGAYRSHESGKKVLF